MDVSKGFVRRRAVRRLHRLAGRAPLRRHHDGPPQRRVRGRDRDGPAPPPGRAPHLHHRRRRGRQRDHHPSDRLGRQGPGRPPRPAPSAGRGPVAHPERHRGAPALRAAGAVRGALRRQGRGAPRPDGAGRAAPCCSCSARPTATSAGARTPTGSTSTARSAPTSPSATAPTSASAPPSPGSRAASRSTSCSPRFPEWDVDWDARRAGADVHRPRLGDAPGAPCRGPDRTGQLLGELDGKVAVITGPAPAWARRR